ncbi:hypothetical protein [Streptomyces sp. NBC_00239]|uniref:hypothetical protein n=1 Tax=Streptomyces sp. NBC_00239 TaxID=2903640 RepID=UPI002E2CC841|nr:hypothetical protein [Streptomyces sp. NBC_00239]
MSRLALLVVLQAVITGLLLLAALGYATYRYPRLVAPLGVVGAFAAAYAGTLAVVVAL